MGWGEGMVERKRERGPREQRHRNGVKERERERGRYTEQEARE